MTHKVHPKIFRIGQNKDWDSKGFYEKNFALSLQEDYEIRRLLRELLRDTGLERVEIERSMAEIGIIIYSSRPGLIIGRGGEGVKVLKAKLEKRLQKISGDSQRKIRLEIKEIKDPWLSAALSAREIARQLERRMPYRKVVKQALHKISMHREIKGVRIEVAGRLNGIEIARNEYFQEGELKRETIRGDIDYAYEMARCPYGAIGIKVFIYKGEKFE